MNYGKRDVDAKGIRISTAKQGFSILSETRKSYTNQEGCLLLCYPDSTQGYRSSLSLHLYDSVTPAPVDIVTILLVLSSRLFAAAAQSIYWYSQWLKTGDRTFLEAILRYNGDDCRTTYHIKDWLANFIQG